MKLHLKEAPKEWRKAALLGLIGPAMITGVLRYRKVVSWTCLVAVLVVVVLVALAALARPRWFRGYYRFATRLGFYTIQFLGKVVLAGFFFLILTPFAWIMRLSGKDFLQLKPPQNKPTFWQKPRKDDSLDRLF